MSGLPIRFMEKVSIGHDSGCWMWEGYRSPTGHGQVRHNGRSAWAHRVAWQELRGPIPAGAHLHHRCGRKACVNPDHLEPLAPREHFRRHRWRIDPNAATHCPHGHEYTPENTYVRPDRDHRVCRTCRLDRQRAYTARRRGGG